MMWRWTLTLACVCMLFLGGTTGCVSEPTKPHDLSGLFEETPPVQKSNVPQPNDAIIDELDPCYVNLDSIVAAMWTYYAKHKELPQTLEELGPTSPLGKPISLTCPASGKPYIYFPQGLQAKNNAGEPLDRLILFDATAAHKGIRYAIIFEPPDAVHPNRAAKLYIIPLEQKLLDYYLQSPQPVMPRPFSPPAE